MDQIWLASPSPAMRLWPASGGASWRLNPAAHAWARARAAPWSESSWRAVAATLSEVHAGSSTREGHLAEAGLRWRSLPMSTGWLVWFAPGLAVADTKEARRPRAEPAIGAQFTKALGLAEVSVWHIDLRDRRVELSDPEHGEANGLTLAELHAMAHPDDLPILAQADRKALRSAAVVDVEARFLARDATTVRHLLTRRVAERDAHGRTIGLLGIALDQTERIAERHRAEGLARQMEVVADAAGVGIWTSDLRTGRAEWNRQMFLIHGRMPGTEPPASEAYTEQIVHPDDRETLREAARRLRHTGEPRLDTEFRIVRPDGSVRWIEYRSRRDDRDGRDVVVGTALDATDRVAARALAERSLREKGAVERASAARSEFLARMSHELRTPLNAVLGFAQLMEHDAAAVPLQDQLDRIVHIRQAGEQLLALVGDVLEHLKQDLPPAPRTTGVDEDAGAADSGVTIKARPLSVLYIEDNPVNVILVEELVGMRPDTVLRCAVDGLGGVAEAEASRPDVVLVDMQLPDIDGFEVLRRLRATKSLVHTAIIALSANGISEDIARARAAGFDDYWTKPIDFRRFLQGLDDLARARRMPAGETRRVGRAPAT